MVLIQFTFDYPKEIMGDILAKQAKDLAESINIEHGFISKIWTENPETKKAGGVYLFQDMESAENYATMHKERVEAMGAKNIECDFFYVNETLSKINHGI